MLLTVRVHVRASRSKTSWNGKLLEVWVTDPPVGGAANKAVLKAVADQLGASFYGDSSFGHARAHEGGRGAGCRWLAADAPTPWLWWISTGGEADMARRPQFRLTFWKAAIQTERMAENRESPEIRAEFRHTNRNLNSKFGRGPGI